MLLVAADGPDGIGLYEVDPAQPGVSPDGRDHDGPDPAAGHRPARRGGGRRPPRASALDLARLRDLACIALSAEQVGAARQALELTVAYTKIREQFGRVIGSFQATPAPAGRPARAGRVGALAVLRGRRGRRRRRARPRAARGGRRGPAAREALTRAAAEMIQLHGAIGITWEHDAHRYFKRAHGDAQLLGPPSDH